MNELFGSVSIYRRGQDPQLLVMHYAPLFTGTGSYMCDGCWGDLVPIDVSEFEKNGLSIVQGSFREYKARRREFGPNDKQGFDLWPANKRQRFFEDHADVGISERQSGEIWLDPTVPDASGLSGSSSEALRLVIPGFATSKEFFAGVMEALRRSRKR